MVFDVNDMLNQLNSSNDDDDDLFMKKETKPVIENTVTSNVTMLEDEITLDPIMETDTETVPIDEPSPIIENNIYSAKPVEEEWKPDAEDLESVPEMKRTLGAVYNKEDVKLVADNKIVNGADEATKKEADETKTEMDRIASALRNACLRNGIKGLHIPEVCHERLALVTIATSKDVDSAATMLDDLLKDIIENHPDWVGERFTEEEMKRIQNQNSSDESILSNNDTPIENPGKPTDDKLIDLPINANNVTIIIDKSHLDDLQWSDDEVEKIRMSKTIHLNIRESSNIDFGNIEDVPEDSISSLLEDYRPHMNGREIVLPISRYRCTITPIPYVEMLEISSDNQINSVDAMRSVWWIVFSHIHNPSIGEWEEYTIYTDSIGIVHKVGLNDPIPDDVISKTRVTKFDDFCMKTAYADLEYILWNLLCVTSSDTEIVTVRCNKITGYQKDAKGNTINDENGRPIPERCSNRYDVVYNPNTLLDFDSIPESVSIEMEQTRTVNGNEIKDWYDDSLVAQNHYVELPSSKIKMVYGIASVKHYLDHLYKKIEETENILKQDNAGSNPTDLRRITMNLVLTNIHGFIFSKNGKNRRIKSVDGITQVLDMLDARDWSAVEQLSSVISQPFGFRYHIGNCRCPKCKSVQDTAINGVSNLLFMIGGLAESNRVSLLN